MIDPVTRGGNRAFIGLGANLGDPERALADAGSRIAALDKTRIVAQSSLYRSSPVGGDGPDYLNQVIEVATGLAPEALLAALMAIEQQAGRERGRPNAPRTLDLDLLLYGDPPALRRSDALILPHPRLHERLFVLSPLAEIAPTVAIPQRGRVDFLLAQLRASPEGAAQRCERWLPAVAVPLRPEPAGR
ncbi:MAG: 2-amino-4-hydroxy-6-hydroxymethyldihydropteridine diphosphokinase [Burkholderiaceae bacterium]|jgi:2-amino-4-hydroxy-6-hydroxymethyldihydropteridine diphosphokinase